MRHYALVTVEYLESKLHFKIKALAYRQISFISDTMRNEGESVHLRFYLHFFPRLRINLPVEWAATFLQGELSSIENQHKQV